MSQLQLSPAHRLGLIIVGGLLALSLLLFASFAEAEDGSTRRADRMEEALETTDGPPLSQILKRYRPYYTRCLNWSARDTGAVWLGITIEHGYAIRPPIGTLWSGQNAAEAGADWWRDNRKIPKNTRAAACLLTLKLAHRAAVNGGID